MDRSAKDPCSTKSSSGKRRSGDSKPHDSSFEADKASKVQRTTSNKGRPGHSVAADSDQRHNSLYKANHAVNTTSMPPRENSTGTEHNFFTLYSGDAESAPKEKDGEVYLWREDFDFFKDAEPEPPPRNCDEIIEGLNLEGLDDFMTQVADCQGIGRGLKLILEPEYEVINKEERLYSHRRVPTPPKYLSVMYDDIPLGRWRRPGENPIADGIGSAAALRPIWDCAQSSHHVPDQTSTLAQKFLEVPSSKWSSNHHPQLHLDVKVCRKMFIWARMMLMNKEDKEILKKTGIYRGVLASIYQCHSDSSLVAAFLTYWNIDGHTLLTSQGEMGYPLHTISDAMGIPITGRLYEEFIPLSCAVRGHVRTLQAIYASLCPATLKPKPGLVTISDWTDHFFDEQANLFAKSSTQDGFANPEDPLLHKLGFQVEVRDGQPVAILGDQILRYCVTYPRLVYRAAFIAAWLCTYCIPVEAGNYIRPEVFHMAVKIAEGNRRAIGISSLAFLYRTLDDAHNDIVGGAGSASECSLFIPGHFIMGWFASFWRGLPASASLTCPIRFAPFIIDFAGIKHIELAEAHHLFWVVDSSGQGLRTLDFLGRSSLRFPKGDKAVYIRDGRIRYQGVPFAISISAMELLISCSVGGITHRRGERFENLVYCPHRFARMFNCDQLTPQFNSRADDGITNSLDFRSYSPNGREESLQIVLRRHISEFRRPDGHVFFAQPLARGTKCSIHYISWYNRSFGFLRDPDYFYDKITLPRAINVVATSMPGAKNTNGAPAGIENKADLPMDLQPLAQTVATKAPTAVAQEHVSLEQKVGGQPEKKDATGMTQQNSLASSTLESNETSKVMATDISEPTAAHSQSENKHVEVDVSPSKHMMEDANTVTIYNSKRGNTVTDPELATESERLFINIKEMVNQLKTDANISKDIQSELISNKFEAHKPIFMHALVDEDSSHCFNYVRMDIQNFQNLIKQRPFDRDRVLAKIDANIKWWEKLFESSPPEVTYLTDAFKALKEALAVDPQPSTGIFISPTAQVNTRAAVIKSSQDRVATTCALMDEITKHYEEQIASQGVRLQNHSSHIQELRSQIQNLNNQLIIAEEAHAQESRLKERTAQCLTRHQERLKETSVLQSQLEAMSRKNHEQLQRLEQVTTHFVGHDNVGLTEHAQSLLHFFLSCFPEP